jgi:hypothetical protein
MLFDQTIFPQCLQEDVYIVFSKMPADAELSDDLIDDFWLGRSVFEEFENSRSDEVEVEHLTLSDVEDDCTVRAVGAAHCVKNSIHLDPHLLDVGCTLTPIAVELQKKLRSFGKATLRKETYDRSTG